MQNTQKLRVIPGTFDNVDTNPDNWMFVDIGFASTKRSSALAVADNPPQLLTFAELSEELVQALKTPVAPVNLVIEAPLSIAFNSEGNPTGRKIEKRGLKTRYWYCGAGAVTLLAASHLMHRLVCADISTEIRLFEGFASFKSSKQPSSHRDDIEAMRSIALQRGGRGKRVCKHELKQNPDDSLCFAFSFAGLDFGVPAVLEVL